ncbi:C39 family peptidase [Hamadaea sp. NPDC051192]|uniref:C39 family peptidase n=1 Tax=Hamadaea sp. NPDC051192 TaxID=3154940 RepID=UPI0034145ED3
MRHDNDVNAMTTIRAKAFNFVRAHILSPRRAASYGLLAVVGAGALALSAAPATTEAATPAAAASVATAAMTAPSKQSTPSKKADSKKAATSTTKRATYKVLKVNYQSQPNFYWCGPAATRNALSAMGHNVTMASLAKTMGTTEAGTDSAYEITSALNKIMGGNKYRTTEIPKSSATSKQADTLKKDIVATIDDNRAVVANVAGTAKDANGGAHSYEGGHYIAVHGYRNDGRQVEIADSADPNSASYWINTTDLANWIATRGYSH